MAKCAYCGSTIFIGGVTSGGQRFCNNKCARGAYVVSVTKQIPAATLDQKVDEVWRGQCPKCLGAGPVDVHKVHQVWSALVLTRWSTRQQVSCRSCATKDQLGGAAFSLVLGWWGFPWGLILTPVQVSRNIAEMCGGPHVGHPSADLRKAVIVSLGSQMIASAKKAPPPVPVPAQPYTGAPPPPMPPGALN